jgi:hypothetical protein
METGSSRKRISSVKNRFDRPYDQDQRGFEKMSNRFVQVMIVSLSVLTLLPVAVQAQGRGGRGRRGPQPGFVAPGVPEMPNPPGPAPKHDLTGTWVGPVKIVMGPYAPMTPAGERAFKMNKPIKRASDNATHVEPNNDPFAICDPLGFPRDLLNHWLSSRGGIEFVPATGRIVMLFEQDIQWGIGTGTTPW